MSIKSISSLDPLISSMKSSVRFGFLSVIFMWVSFLGCCMAANSHESIAAMVFAVCILIDLILYFKNNNRNALLKIKIQDYYDVKNVPAFASHYDALVFLSKVIGVMDMTIVLWPVSFPIKLIFGFKYRRIRSVVKKMRKLFREGQQPLDIKEMEDDPFYSFLMREGLYGEGPIEDEEDVMKILEKETELVGEDEFGLSNKDENKQEDLENKEESAEEN